MHFESEPGAFLAVPAGAAPLPALAPVRRVLMADVVVEHLRRHIEAGVFRDLLPSERDLAEMLGASRPVVRQALKRLEKAGMLVRRSNRLRRILPPPA